MGVPQGVQSPKLDILRLVQDANQAEYEISVSVCHAVVLFQVCELHQSRKFVLDVCSAICAGFYGDFLFHDLGPPDP